MGTSSAWLAFTGEHDDVDGGAGPLVIAGTSSHGKPAWFVRSEPLPGVGARACLPRSDRLSRRRTCSGCTTAVVIGDRMWTREEIKQAAADHAGWRFSSGCSKVALLQSHGG